MLLVNNVYFSVVLSSPYVRADNMSRAMRKPTFWFPTWSDPNQAVQLQELVRGLKFQI